MKIYMEVTHDKYELPVVIADTVEELGRMTGTSPSGILCMIARYNRGSINWTRFRRVVVEDDEE